MNTTDPVADMITRIRNAQKAKHDVVAIPASKLKIAIAMVLQQEGFIRAFKCIRDNKQGVLKIALKYNESGNATIHEVIRKSTASRRYYVGAEKIPFVRNGFGVAVLSTSQGVMTCREARKRKVGGEVLLSIY